MGGTYCDFRVGTAGASSAHVSYISRKSAVEERTGGVCGFAAWNLPEEVLQAETFAELRDNLTAFAQVREEEERGRTHYRCTLSFERETPTERIKALAVQWLREAFPNARAIVFVHRNTAHPHAHVWLDARQTDGKKIDLAPRQFRSLDETWNRIYTREMGRDEREHLAKKEETRAYRLARGQGQERDAPRRAVRMYDEARVGGEDRSTVGGTYSGARAEPEARRVVAAHDRALRETYALRAEFESLGRRALERDLNDERL